MLLAQARALPGGCRGNREHRPEDLCVCARSPQDPRRHPWPCQPPALGCGPLVRRALRPGQDEHGGEQAQPAGHADPHAEPQLHRAGGAAGPRGAWPHAALLQVQQGHQVSPGHRGRLAGVLGLVWLTWLCPAAGDGTWWRWDIITTPRSSPVASAGRCWMRAAFLRRKAPSSARSATTHATHPAAPSARRRSPG